MLTVCFVDIGVEKYNGSINLSCSSQLNTMTFLSFSLKENIHSSQPFLRFVHLKDILIIMADVLGDVANTLVNIVFEDKFNQIKDDQKFRESVKAAIAEWHNDLQEDVYGLTSEECQNVWRLIADDTNRIATNIVEIAKVANGFPVEKEKTQLIAIIHNSIHKNCKNVFCYKYKKIEVLVSSLIETIQRKVINTTVDIGIRILFTQSEERIVQSVNSHCDQILQRLNKDPMRDSLLDWQQFDVCNSEEEFRYLEDNQFYYEKKFTVRSNADDLKQISFWYTFVSINQQNTFSLISPVNAEFEISKDRINKYGQRVIEITVKLAEGICRNDKVSFEIRTIQKQPSSWFSVTVPKYNTSYIKKTVVFADSCLPRTIWKADISVTDIDCIEEFPSFPHSILKIDNNIATGKWDRFDNQRAYVLYWHLQ